MKKRSWQVFAVWIGLCEAVGLLAGLLTRKNTAIYAEKVIKPFLSPPGWVFPVAWTVLYALMGIGAALVSMAPPSRAGADGLRYFFLQLGFNFLWSLLFFNAMAFGFAFLWLLALWGLIWLMTRAFSQVDPTAGRLQLPYLLWVAFAGYLNLGVWLLNR